MPKTTISMNNITERMERLIRRRTRMIKEGRDLSAINRRIADCEREYCGYLAEDTSATGGPGGSVTGSSVGSSGVALAGAATAGMGAVTSPQPSSLAGATTGAAWSSGGGTSGSGDIGFPFPAGGGKRMYQKAEMGRSHGAMTGKKSRQKRMSMKQVRDALSRRQDFTKGSERPARTGASPKAPSAPQRVMSWQDFQKSDINRVKKVKY